MKKLLVAATLCSLVFAEKQAIAQNKACGTDVVIQNIVVQNPQLQAAYAKYEQDVQDRAAAYAQQATTSAAKTTATYNLPIVFHVILSQAQIAEIGGTQGIYDRIASQIVVLNRDYSGSNFTADQGKIRPEFISLFGNANIAFGVAHTKYDGSQATGTTGVDFKVQGTSFTGFDVTDNSVKQTNNGGLDPWDVKKYINIWITHITTSVGSGQVLGYAYNPKLATVALGDVNLAGVVIDYKAFGKRSSFNQVFFGSADQGRTMVHELGHFFTLNHIWGNVSPGSGTCTNKVKPSNGNDDGVDDTPPQKDANQTTCPSGEKANCLGTAGGEMYMNYMDYVQDVCMVMFSKGQVARIQSEFTAAGGSYGLLSNGGALNWPTGISSVEANNAFDITPNPSTGAFHITFAKTVSTLRSVTVMNMMGQSVKEVKDIEQTNDMVVDITGMPAGIYTVNCRFDEGIVTKKIVLQ